VLRDESGWRITDNGRNFLTTLETTASAQPTENDAALAASRLVGATLRLVVDNTSRTKSDQEPDETRRSA
jgi:hypothetical protein